MSIINKSFEVSLADYYNRCEILINPTSYYTNVLNKYKEAKRFFPLLELVIIPYNEPRNMLLRGILLTKEDIENMHLDQDQFPEYGLEIVAVINENFLNTGLEVYDAGNRINWEQVPDEIKHYRGIQKRHYWLCTHHYKDINEDNCFLDVLKNAYYLFLEYQKYDKTKTFNIKCLPHGDIYGERKVKPITI